MPGMLPVQARLWCIGALVCNAAGCRVSAQRTNSAEVVAVWLESIRQRVEAEAAAAGAGARGSGSRVACM